MGPFALAWITAEGLVTWQSFKRDRMPPGPGRLAVISGLYIGLAILSEYRPARGVIATFAWAVNLAVLVQVVGKTPKATNAAGWAGIPCAGNTVIFPDGTEKSAALASANTTTATATSTGAATAPTSGTVTQMLTQLAGQFGWNNSQQISAWTNLLGRESSGGQANARNPASGAYGAAQALGHGGSNTACPQTGENNYGGFGLTAKQAQAANCGNLADQLLWMAGYIKATYGSPVAAWSHEQSAGWY
jgi:hypothetical protein